jgi:hypothetical protein
MAEKTAAVKREILMSLIQRYGHKEPKILVAKAKERGIYHLSQDDKEIYTLMEKFAEYHHLPFGFNQVPKEAEHVINQIVAPIDSEEDTFFTSLLKERDVTIKRLIALDKLIKTYKNE